MQAVGIYIRTLRIDQGLTAMDVASAVGSNPNYIWRIETNQMKNPGLDLVFKIVAVLKGSGDHIMELMIAKEPTAEYAQSLAKQAQLTPDQIEQAGLFFSTDEDTRVLLESILASSHDKALIAMLSGYLSGLRARAGVPPSASPPQTSRRPRKK